MSTQKSKKNLIVISVDALNKHDFDYIKTLPNFKMFLEQGAYVREMTSVYPSLTYVAHTSMITGTYPDKHGIFNNEIATPNVCNKQPWYWFEKDIKVPTLFDYANKAGMSTANVLWPCMTEAPIKYNMPEKWSVSGKSTASEILKYVSKNLLFILLKNMGKAKGIEQPYLDNFVEGMATDIILKKKPNLLTIHLIELDSERHHSGLSGPKKEAVLREMDNRIGRLIAASKKAGTFEATNFVVLGDHGGTDFTKIVTLNTLFKNEGLLTAESETEISSWKAYACSCGGSVHIHIHDDASSEEKAHIESVIDKFCSMPDTCIKKKYTKAEVKDLYNLDGSFSYVLEPKDGYIFKNYIKADVITDRALIKGAYKLDHGQEPSHPDLKTMFMAMGPDIIPGIHSDKHCIVDVGPTLAKLLNLEMSHIDGSAMTELIK